MKLLFTITLIFTALVMYAQNDYDPKDSITMDGEFKDRKLWNGRHYIYDEYGLLDHIEVFKEGKYVGNGILWGTQEIVIDTINQKDQDHKKIGHWRIYGNMRNLPEYKSNQVIEEGEYYRNRKIGPWIKYWPNGNIKYELIYVNGRPSGKYVTYYKSGNIEEKGTFTSNRYEGDLIRYYPSGCITYKKYFDKTDIIVEYYYDDCDTSTSFIGNNEISFVSFHSNHFAYRENIPRALVYKRAFGVCDTCSLKTILDTVTVPEIQFPKHGDSSNILRDEKDKTYNSDGDILTIGEYISGEFWSGKYYIYNNKGHLKRIDFYIGGECVAFSKIKHSIFHSFTK